jgi:hypothetical protein
MAVTRAWWPSQHYSSGGLNRRLIAFHTTEGSQTAESLRNWLTNPSSKVSYHFAVDMSHGANWAAQFVRDGDRAWAQANYNGQALSIAFCTPSGAASGWSRSTWLSKGDMLTAAGRLAGELAKQFGIPLTQLTSSQAQGSTKGLCEHKNFGSGGGNHHDCGSGFPMDRIIEIARGGGGSSPAPAPSQEVDVSADVAYDRDGNPHFAWLSTRGQVMYFPPGRAEAYAVDSTQSGAKSGVGIAINPANLVMLAYTNGSGAPCTYQKPVNTGSWSWASRGAANSAR